MINNIRKKLQSLFKKATYGIFKILYGPIKDFKKSGSDKNSRIELSKVADNYSYKIYINYEARIYTDTINDTAIIQDNRLSKVHLFK